MDKGKKRSKLKSTKNTMSKSDDRSSQKHRARLKVRLKWNKEGECHIENIDDSLADNNGETVKQEVDETESESMKTTYNESDDAKMDLQNIEDITSPLTNGKEEHTELEQPNGESSASEFHKSATKTGKRKGRKCDPEKESKKKDAIEKVVYVCEECGKKYKSKSQYLTHSFEHTGQHPFVCDECGKGFKRACHLRDHMTIHTGQKRHMCSHCGKGFTVNASLKVHMMTHSGEKPHMCSECGRCFTRSSDMLKHLRGHSGLKPFVCSECGKTFGRKQHLTSHIDTQHKNIKPCVCNECGKAFYRPRQLEIHMRSHTGERPFLCYLCGKGFASNSTLQEHVRIHAVDQAEYKRKNSERKRKLRAKKKLEKKETEAMNLENGPSTDSDTMVPDGSVNIHDGTSVSEHCKNNIDFNRIVSYVNQAVSFGVEDSLSNNEEDMGNKDVIDKNNHLNMIDDRGEAFNIISNPQLQYLPNVDRNNSIFSKTVFSDLPVAGAEYLGVTDGIADNKLSGHNSGQAVVSYFNSGDKSSGFVVPRYDIIKRIPPPPTESNADGVDYVKIDDIGNVCSGQVLNMSTCGLMDKNGTASSAASFLM